MITSSNGGRPGSNGVGVCPRVARESRPIRELKNGSDEILVLRCTLAVEGIRTIGLREEESRMVILPDVMVVSEILRECANRSLGWVVLCVVLCLRISKIMAKIKTAMMARPPITPPTMAPIGVDLDGDEGEDDVGSSG